MTRKIISAVLFLVVLVSFCSIFVGFTRNDIPVPQPRQDVFVYDEDNIIEDRTEHDLNQMLVRLERETSVEFAVITVSSLQSNSIETYSNYVFNTMGIGKKGKDNGILLLISRSDHRVRLEIGRGLEDILTDSKCGRILDEFFVPYREQDAYTTATDLTVKAILSVLSSKYNITIDGLDTRAFQLPEEQHMSIGTIILIAVCVIIVLLILEYATGKAFGYRRGFGHGIVTEILSSSGSSSNYSSSYSSSSSGGGFGGGFSGGGGASR